MEKYAFWLATIKFVCLSMDYKGFDANPFFESINLTEMFWEDAGISYSINSWFF